MIWENSYDDLEKIRNRINFMMQRMWEPIGEEISSINSFPVDISEEDDSIVVKAELPGFEKDDISVRVTEENVEISVEKKQKKIQQTEKMIRAERRYGKMKRSFRLPAKVDYQKTDAKFENGLLTLKIPKKEKKKIGKKVLIK